MATIVLHRPTQTRFVLVGAGYGMFQSSSPSVFFSNWSPDEDTDAHSMLAVCDADGNVGWAPCKELQVISVNGTPPGALLSTEPFR